MEERAADAAVRLRNLDAHHAEVEQLVDQRARDLRLFVHLAHERPDLRVGEFAHAGAQQLLVFGEVGERKRRSLGRLGRHGANVIIALSGAFRGIAVRIPPRPLVCRRARSSARPSSARPACAARRRRLRRPIKPQQPTFRARVDSVSVDVIVTDRQGRAGHRSEGRGLRDQGSQPRPEDRRVQVHLDRRDAGAGSAVQARHPVDGRDAAGDRPTSRTGSS